MFNSLLKLIMMRLYQKGDVTVGTGACRKSPMALSELPRRALFIPPASLLQSDTVSKSLACGLWHCGLLCWSSQQEPDFWLCSASSHPISYVCTMRLMGLKLQNPSFARAPSKALQGPLAVCVCLYIKFLKVRNCNFRGLRQFALL